MLAGGKERRNTAMVVVEQPNTHERKGISREGSQSLADWLTNVAFWNTYPTAPVKLDPNRTTDKNHIRAWLRIRQYVGKGLALLPNLGTHPRKPNADDIGNANWHRWALAVSFSSSLRTVSQLRAGLDKAWEYVFLKEDGLAWLAKHIGKSEAGRTAHVDGLLADAAVWLMKGVQAPKAELQKWPETMTKSFASANNIMVLSK